MSLILMKVLSVIGALSCFVGLSVCIYKLLGFIDNVPQKRRWKKGDSYKLYKRREKEAAQWLGRWGA